MPVARRQIRASASRSASQIAVPDSSFPRAVAGEHYDRYLRAVWAQAERWFSSAAPRINHIATDTHAAREILCALAARDVGRRLHALEERLIDELLLKSWSKSERVPGVIEPEIPNFLIA